jgi:RNA polymerase sigma factor (sigma-70 family)
MPPSTDPVSLQTAAICEIACLHVVHDQAKIISIHADVRAAAPRAAAMQDALYLHLYKSHYFNLKKNIATQFRLDAESAADIAQNIFLKLWEKKETIHQIAAPDSYLFTMAKNFFFLDRRATKRKSIRDKNFARAQPAADDSTDQIIIYNDTRRHLQHATSQLSPRLRQTQNLRIEGYKIKEIAARMNIGEQLVKNNLQKAQKKLRCLPK